MIFILTLRPAQRGIVGLFLPFLALCSCSASASKDPSPTALESPPPAPPANEVFTFELHPAEAPASTIKDIKPDLLMGAVRHDRPASIQLGLFRLGASLEYAYSIAANDKVMIFDNQGDQDQVCSTGATASKTQIFQYYPKAVQLLYRNNLSYLLTISRRQGLALVSEIDWQPPQTELSPKLSHMTFGERGIRQATDIQKTLQTDLGSPSFVERGLAPEYVTRWCTRGDATCEDTEPGKPSVSIHRQMDNPTVKLSAGKSALTAPAPDKGCRLADPAEKSLFLTYLDSLQYNYFDADGPPIFRISGIPDGVRRILPSNDGDFQFCRKVNVGMVCFFQTPPSGGDYPSTTENVTLFLSDSLGNYKISADEPAYKFARDHVRSRQVVLF